MVEPFARRTGATGEKRYARVGDAAMELDTRDYVQRRVYLDSFEVDEARVFSRLLRPGDVVWDVGANCGFFTLLTAVLVGPTGRVHAFEPVPANRAALERNLALNPGLPVVVRPEAVGAHTGELLLGVDHADGAGTVPTSGHYTPGGAHKQVTAPMINLDAYLDQTREPPHVIKVDVEGFEPEVLDGFADTLASTPPWVLMLEMSERLLKESGTSSEEMLGRIAGYGYSLYRVASMGTVRPVRRGGSPCRERALFNLLALQPEVYPRLAARPWWSVLTAARVRSIEEAHPL